MKGRILFYLTITICSEMIKSSPIGISTENPTHAKPSQEKNTEPKNVTSETKTIEDLVKQQTDTVKKIVADHKQQTNLEYPVITKLDPQYTEEAKKEIEKLSLEELKIKCQHLSRLFNLNKTSDNNKSTYHSIISTPSRYANHKPIELTRRPVYIPSKPTFRPRYTTTAKPNGFFITTQGPVTKKPVGTQPAPIKYIRLEPVILQKTILSDGRTVYYWHRSLPTAVELTDDATQNNHVSNSPSYQYSPYNDYYSSMYNNYGNTPYSYAQNAYIPAAPNSYAPAYASTYSTQINTYVEDKKPIETTTESSTTSTTEQSSYSGYGFGSFLPFYSYSRQDPTTTTTTTEPTTTTSTTKPEPTEKLKPDELLYAQQLRFVIPVPYENMNGAASTSVRHPWDFDQYAYYPRELQPNTMNVQVPYSPTFHMIRAVAVPKSEGNVNENLDQAKA